MKAIISSHNKKILSLNTATPAPTQCNCRSATAEENQNARLKEITGKQTWFIKRPFQLERQQNRALQIFEVVVCLEDIDVSLFQLDNEWL